MRGFCWSSPVPKAPGLFSNKQICGGGRKENFFWRGEHKKQPSKTQGLGCVYHSRLCGLRSRVHGCLKLPSRGDSVSCFVGTSHGRGPFAPSSPQGSFPCKLPLPGLLQINSILPTWEGGSDTKPPNMLPETGSWHQLCPLGCWRVVGCCPVQGRLCLREPFSKMMLSKSDTRAASLGAQW